MTMEQQQLATMLSIEKHVYPVKAVRSHPRRRLIADSLNKVRSPARATRSTSMAFSLVLLLLAS